MTGARLLRRSFLAIVLAVAAWTQAACAVPVRAERVGAEAVYASVHANVLTSGAPSVTTHLVLERSDLSERWDDDPAAAIVALHGMAVTADTRERLFGLAELSIAEGRRTGEPRWFLGAAVYAYLFLFGRADEPPPGPFDPRFRLACDLYARGVAGAFLDAGSGEFVPRAGRLELPVGAIDVSVPSPVVTVGAAQLDAFESADEWEVKGMRSRVRSEGLGAPLIARRRLAEELAADGKIAAGRVPARVRMAATALLTIDGELADLAPGKARAVLALSSPLERTTATVRGHPVPLATDFTAPIARGLGESKLWDFELRAFFSRDDETMQNGLAIMSPYRRGAIPIVLVHGTASSPARWAELVNELAADPVISQRYTCWLFIYGTGSPILSSAASLRSAIRETVRVLDPQGSDPALQRMVLIGHSQGGLLSRLMVTSSGDRFWRNASDQPFASMDLDAEERALLEGAFFFEPVPQVERVIFVSTPHCGSYVAGNFIGKLGGSLVSLPRKLVDSTTGAFQRNVARIRGDFPGALPTAVDNMEPGSTFLTALAELPMDPRVKVNSIVSVDDDGPPEGCDDGVVAYESAHLACAESECVVRCDHSCQGHPQTILEIRRILRAHAAVGGPPPSTRGGLGAPRSAAPCAAGPFPARELGDDEPSAAAAVSSRTSQGGPP